MDKTKDLGTKSIGKLLATYSIPAVIAMLVNAIYNVVDRIFIGQYVGEGALAGLTVAFPLMMITFAIVNLVGTGGSSLLAIRFGEQDERGANHVFGNTLSMGIILAVITLVIVSLNLETLLQMFGATSDVLSYSMTYMAIILGGYIFQMLSFVLSSSVRTEGKPVLSMAAMITSALTNIVLDFVFIVLLDMGVAGAAYATIIGQLMGLVLLSSFYLRGRSLLKPRLNDYMLDLKVISNIATIGFATFLTTVGTSVAMIFMNRALVAQGGTEAITAMGAINSLYTFFIMPVMGITQGMQPIMGYNHGARLKERVNKTLKYGLMVTIGFSTVVFLGLQLLPEAFVSLFLENESTIQTAANGLQIYMIMLPLLSLNMVGVAYFQSVAQGRMSIVLGMIRQFIFLIPLVLILPAYFGLNGVWAAVPIADGLAIVVSAFFLLRDTKKDTYLDLDLTPAYT